MKIRDFMSKDVMTVDENMKVIDAAKIMGEKRVGSVIVTKEGKPYGIFTERDLLSKAILDNGLDNPVKNYTSTPLITVNPDYSINEVSKIMADMKIRRLVVVEDDKIVGIFTASDLTKALAKR